MSILWKWGWYLFPFLHTRNLHLSSFIYEIKLLAQGVKPGICTCYIDLTTKSVLLKVSQTSKEYVRRISYSHILKALHAWRERKSDSGRIISTIAFFLSNR